jgi:hypothetical protein
LTLKDLRLNQGIAVETGRTKGKSRMASDGIRANLYATAEMHRSACSGREVPQKRLFRKLAAKGSFQAGQTAKALSGYRVQSLPEGDMAASRIQAKV